MPEFPLSTGRVVRRSHLLRLGHTPSAIRRAVRRSDIIRVRRGWYAHPDADPKVLAAVRSGAVVTCVSALSHHGVWSPVWFARDRAPVHARHSEYRELRSPPAEPGVLICRPVERDARPCPGAVDSIDDALISAARCQPGDWLTVLLDSVMQRGLRTRQQLADLHGSPGSAFQRALLRATGWAESGTETLTMLGLRRRNLRFRQQVRLGPHRVDFLIGDRLIVEVDGEGFHNSAEAFEADRLRDRRFVAAGYIVIRITYQQAMRHLDAALDDICRVVARGDHRF